MSDLVEPYSFVAEGKPRPKGRPRFNRKTGTAFTPKTTVEYERLIAAAYDGPSFDGPVSVNIDIRPDLVRVVVCPVAHGTKLRGDIDNYAKAVLDGMQGHAYDNDSQVVRLVVNDLTDMGNDEVTVR